MAPRRRIRRPWYRTRAYRLTRTAALAVTLVTGAVWWGHAEEPPDAAVLTVGSAGPTGGGADTRGPDPRARSGPAAPENRREEPFRHGTGLSGPARPPSGAPSPAVPASGTPSARARQSAAGVSPARVRPSPPGKPSVRVGQSPRGASPSRPRPTRPVSSPSGPRRPPPASGAASAPGRAGASRPASRPTSRPAPGTPSTATAHPRTGKPPAAAPRPAAGGTRAARPRPRPTPQGAAKGIRVLPRSRAARLAIPYLDLDAPVMDLRLDGRRRLPAPPEDDPNLVGWYADGPSPGGPGTAVAVGHLDTDTGPAVFSGLSELGRGRRIEIRRADGRTAVYTVDRIKNYEKAHFPDREVYGDRGRPELRLITCGGTFDRGSGYSGNLVVFAHLTKIREPAGPPR
ncbi:class F sortase [Streptomyces bobili]|uniref:class F sortase n=1 Tax=Streptomyces bobili TaxID=67280 RepID=UPI0033A5CBB8